ncbi:S-adenosyl-L-methionine-dependent methyltransferase [Daldinia vernicosa]|uniref:S-adenosyl-L-methionine-dependent methyltransferase n=1 Tax=Daldinia vernicosa TaxID=114800 RepID=UPI002007D2D5|nr:S-adenosyl-L-methionine-dependent methyltransferase [Daldinia vernicosa]KAI0852999.1 S-adenosyl-L-methionine-dependent methyltransferase [Daldinia vernicosa]
MASTLVSMPSTNTTVKQYAFAARQGTDWSYYLAHRPAYPQSFFERIYSYHAQKSGAAWSVAHDIGAGCGVVSAVLASRFDSVIVSDPNDGYTKLAREYLLEKTSFPESKFKFLQETAEESSVGSGTVDLIAACECIHWTTPDVAIGEFGRQLGAGGTLAITYYTRPLIEGNERAARAWKAVWDAFPKKVQRYGIGENPYKIGNTALESLEFPEENWEAIKRIYINSQGTVDSFMLDDRIIESRVKESEEKVWVEEDDDWCDVCDIEWLKGYVATWEPRLQESEIQDIWDELEAALEGKPVKTRTPIVMILATKRG